MANKGSPKSKAAAVEDNNRCRGSGTTPALGVAVTASGFPSGPADGQQSPVERTSPRKSVFGYHIVYSSQPSRSVCDVPRALAPGARSRVPLVNRDEALAEAAEIPGEMDRLRAAIAALAARRRAAVEALLADGMTQAEIARRLRVTQRAVAKILGR